MRRGCELESLSELNGRPDPSYPQCMRDVRVAAANGQIRHAPNYSSKLDPEDEMSCMSLEAILRMMCTEQLEPIKVQVEAKAVIGNGIEVRGPAIGAHHSFNLAFELRCRPLQLPSFFGKVAACCLCLLNDALTYLRNQQSAKLLS